MPPRVEVSPPTQYHLAGSTAVLRCRANGLPAPDVAWEFNDTPIRGGADENGQRRFTLLRTYSSSDFTLHLFHSRLQTIY